MNYIKNSGGSLMADSLITLRNAALTAEIDLQKQTLTILDLSLIHI